MTRVQDSVELLRLLAEGGLEFALVGGFAAVVHGSSYVTQDVDVAIAFTEENLEVLLRLLAPHHPVLAQRPDLSLLDEPMAKLMQARGLYLDTELGRLDVLRTIAGLGEYEDLETVERELLGTRIRLLSLDALIASKQHLGRPKDHAVATELLAVRDRLAEEE